MEKRRFVSLHVRIRVLIHWPRQVKVHTPVAQWLTEKQPSSLRRTCGGHPEAGSPEKSKVLVERKDVEAEAVVLVLAGVVISELEAGVQRDFTSGHEPCRYLTCL